MVEGGRTALPQVVETHFLLERQCGFCSNRSSRVYMDLSTHECVEDKITPPPAVISLLDYTRRLKNEHTWRNSAPLSDDKDSPRYKPSQMSTKIRKGRETRFRKLFLESLEPRLALAADPPFFYVDIQVKQTEDNNFPRATFLKSQHTISQSENFGFEDVNTHKSDYHNLQGIYLGRPTGESSLKFIGTVDNAGRNIQIELQYELDQGFSTSLSPYYSSSNELQITGAIYVRANVMTRFSNKLTYYYSKLEQSDGQAFVTTRLSGGGITPPLNDWGLQDQTHEVSSITYPNLSREINGVTYKKISGLWFNAYVGASDGHWYSPSSFYYGKVSYSAKLEIEMENKLPIAIAEFQNKIGVGQTVTLDGSASFDPDNMDGDSGIKTYEWYARRSGEVGETFIGTGPTVQYHPSLWGVYDILLITTDDEGTQSAEELPLTVNVMFLNMIEHGLVPLRKDLAKTHSTFQAYGAPLREIATPYMSSLPSSQFKTASVDWDSNKGFMEAMFFGLLYKSYDEIPVRVIESFRPDALFRVLRKKFEAWTAYKYFVAQSRREASIAAKNVASFVASEVEKIKNDLTQPYAINLIGHSRGGYVVSRASEILKDDYGIGVCTVTLLDGFASDWPHPSDMIADGDIVGVAKADRRYNYRVQDPLAKIPDAEGSISSTLATWYNNTFWNLAMGNRVESDSVKRFLEWLTPSFLRDQQAPVRPFESNEFVLDPKGKVKSNHLNIHELYFTPDQPLLRDTLWRQPGYCKSLTKQRGSGEAEAPVATFDPSVPQLLSSRSLKELRGAQKDAQADSGLLGEFLSDHDAWLDSLFMLSARPRWIESSLFSGVNAQLIDSGADAGLRFSVGGSVEVPADLIKGRNWFYFRFDEASLKSNSQLTIKVDNQTLFSWNQAMLSSSQGSIKVPWDATVTADRVTVTGNEITLLEFVSSPKDEAYELSIGNPFNSPDKVVEMRVDELFGKTAQEREVQVYLESNGQAGLQIEGEGADQLLVRKPWNTSDDFVEQVSLDIPPGVTASLHAIVVSDGQVMTMNSVDVVFSSDESKWLTNKANRSDVDRDLNVSPLDVLCIINELNQKGSTSVFSYDNNNFLLDVDADGYVSPLDVLVVVNELNTQSGMGEGEGGSGASEFSGVESPVVDNLFEDFLLEFSDLDKARRSRKTRLDR